MITFALMVVDGNQDFVGSYVFVMDTDGGDVHRLPGFGDPAWQALP